MDNRINRCGVGVIAMFFLLRFGLYAHAVEGITKGVPDPTIIQSKEDGAYYIFSTSRGIAIHRSVDLVSWERVGRVFDTSVPDWARAEVPGSRNIWAPEIAHFNEKYHLYYSVSTFGSQRSCVGLATNVTLDPAGKDYKWIDRGKVIESAPGKTDFNAIDASPFIDKDGKIYLAFGSFWDGIKMVHIDPATGKPNPVDSRRYSLARRPVHHAIEAAYIVRHNDYYYLFVSFDACCEGINSTYRIMVGRSKQVTGQYFDIEGKAMTDGGGSLVLASHENWRGPGHNSVIQTPQGDFLVHHTYDARETRGGRNLQIRPLFWTSHRGYNEGWPMVGEPLTQSPGKEVKLEPSILLGKWRHLTNYEVESTVTILPEGRLSTPDSDNRWDRWALDGNTLIMHWDVYDGPEGEWLEEFHVAPDGKSYIGRRVMGFKGTVIRGIKQAD